MKPVYWDDPDPRVVFDNPNFYWGDPAYLLEPGDEGYVELHPGDPGYVPPAPPPRRHRRRPSSAKPVEANAEPHPTMNPLRYIVYMINNLYTAKVHLREAVKEGEFLDTLAARSQLTRVQVEKVITEQFALFVEHARHGRPVDFILRRFRMLPSAGGRYQGPDPDNMDVCDTLSFSVIVHPEEIDKMRDSCPLEKAGEAGENAPEVDSIRARPGNVLNKYGVGTTAFTEVNGNNFRDRRADAPWPTAALVDEDGSNPVPLPVADCTPTRLVLGGAPAGTTGTKFLKVTGFDGNFTVDDEPLTAL